jgi:hypothetical protein
MKTNFNIVLIIVLLFISACQNEAEIQPRDYPFVITKDATKIDVEGVTFNAEILNVGTEKIVDYGFLWRNAESEFTYSIKQQNKLDEFTTRITNDLQKDEQYIYQAYIKTSDNLILSNQIVFQSKGSMPPVITDFYPKEGFDRDLITIIGNNFSYKATNNRVYVNNLPAEVIYSTIDSIVFRIPDSNFSGENAIKLEVGKAFVDAVNKLNILAPQLENISVNEGYSGDIIHISGNNLFRKNDDVSLKFGGFNAEILTIENSYIKAVVPSVYNIPLEDYISKIQFTNNQKTTEYNEPFKIKPSWRKKNGLSFPVNNSQIVTFQGKAYFLEQYRPVIHQYDPIGDKWNQLNSSDNPTQRHEKSLQIVIGDSLYFIGGNVDFVPSNKLWTFDFTERKWHKKANLPFNFLTATYFILDNLVHVVTNDGQHWKCNFQDERYLKLNNFPENFTKGGYFGFGFISESKVFLVTAEHTFEYDQVNDRWINRTDNNYIESDYQLSSVGFNYKGCGYVFYPQANAIFKYNVLENKWINTAYYPDWVDDHARFNIFELNDMVYIENINNYNTNMFGYKNE